MVIIIFRSIIVFVCLLAAMRAMGKRQLGELELSELVVAVIISDMAAHPIQDTNTPLINGLIPVIVLLCCEILISYISLKSIKFRTAFFGKPSILIQNGTICQSEMKKNRFSLDELCEQLRNNNVTDISTVRYGILETGGNFNVILNANQQPLTAETMNIQVSEKGMPIELVSDGRILSDNLKLAGKDEKWLNSQLRKRNIINTDDVYYMSIDESGGIYFAFRQAKGASEND